MQMLRRLFGLNPTPAGSGLDIIIPPEIKDDPFYAAIQSVAATEGLRNILEIGSSSGAGSTEAFVTGIARNPDPPILYCMEVSEARYHALRDRYSGNPDVRCYNVSSVPVESFPEPARVEAFYRETPSPLNDYPLETVLGWLRQDIEYVLEHGSSAHGIRQIKQENAIDRFDAVLIDGSEFTGAAELEEVYGARFLLLDDVRTYKNHANWTRLSADPAYRLVQEELTLRNGFAVFEAR